MTFWFIFGGLIIFSWEVEQTKIEKKPEDVCEGALFAFYIDSLKHLIASQRNLLEEAS